MLQRLALHDPVGCLRPESLLPEVVFGRHTVIYGHNGSGKSTLADLIAAIGSGGHASAVMWHGPNGTGQRIAPGERPSQVHVSAFTASWVTANLASFLSGEGPGADAIVTLGSEAVDATSEIEKCERRIGQLRPRQRTLEVQEQTITDALTAECEQLQSEIYSTLNSTNRYYSKSRFTVPSVGHRLAKHAGGANDDEQHAGLVDEARRSGMPSLELRSFPSTDWADLAQRVLVVMDTTPTGLLLDDLAGVPLAQHWVEQGMDLHTSQDKCWFCEGTVTTERRAALDRHFDESRARVTSAARALHDECERLDTAHRLWIDSLPTPEQLYPEVRGGWQSTIDNLSQQQRRVAGYLKEVGAILDAKSSAPETRGRGELPQHPEDAHGGDLLVTMAEHNRIASGHAARAQECCDAAMESMVGRRAAAYQILQAQHANLTGGLVDVRDELQATIDREQHLRGQSFTSSEMAAHLTRDLDRVYGKHHLKISATADGKSYVCTRDGAPAVNLSEGERRTLALLYFLRALEDTSPPIDPRRRLVVVDDPSSSLDRECVFGTHDWLRKSLEPYGQSIILTHDFELLRMLINSGRSNVGKFSKWLMADEGTRSPQPEMAFLEISASTTRAGRTSRLANISKVVLEHPSEYHFLFDRVAAGVEGSTDYDILFLLPNAARRLLETFASFRVPDGKTHYYRMRELCKQHEGADFQDVYDFCNRFSHGEDRQVAEPLEARVVLREITRCMEFLRAVDEPHYLAMMRATSRDVEGVISLPDSTVTQDRSGLPTVTARGGASH